MPIINVRSLNVATTYCEVSDCLGSIPFDDMLDPPAAHHGPDEATAAPVWYCFISVALVRAATYCPDHHAEGEQAERDEAKTASGHPCHHNGRSHPYADAYVSGPTIGEAQQ